VAQLGIKAKQQGSVDNSKPLKVAQLLVYESLIK